MGFLLVPLLISPFLDGFLQGLGWRLLHRPVWLPFWWGIGTFRDPSAILTPTYAVVGVGKHPCDSKVAFQMTTCHFEKWFPLASLKVALYRNFHNDGYTN